jgi:hypothetical protein
MLCRGQQIRASFHRTFPPPLLLQRSCQFRQCLCQRQLPILKFLFSSISFFLHLSIFRLLHLFYSPLYSTPSADREPSWNHPRYPSRQSHRQSHQQSNHCHASPQMSPARKMAVLQYSPGLRLSIWKSSLRDLLGPRLCSRMRISPLAFGMDQARTPTFWRGVLRRCPCPKNPKPSRPTMRKRSPVAARIIHPGSASSRTRLWSLNSQPVLR